MPNCQIRIYGDQTQCATCGRAWDTNDPDPPECPPPETRLSPRQLRGQAVLDKLKKKSLADS